MMDTIFYGVIVIRSINADNDTLHEWTFESNTVPLPNRKSKRFHLFVGDIYYPNKFGDYRGSFITQEEAEKEIDADASGRWVQILFTQDDGTLVLVSDKQYAFD